MPTEFLSGRTSALVASALATAAGGAMDAWVYLEHGHVFATAQTGNVVLMGIAVAQEDFSRAATYLPSLSAFVLGCLLSRLSGEWFKHRHLNSRNIRLAIECVLLVALGAFADHMADRAVTVSVGFIAGLQITSLSHIGSWSFNTGMTTGNLRSAVSALARALTGVKAEWSHAGLMFVLCLAFGAGVWFGAWLSPRLGGRTAIAVATLIALVIVTGPWKLDPIPEWKELE